jgi:hypothetical protein
VSIRAIAFAIVAALAMHGAASATQASDTAASARHPDLSGFWALAPEPIAHPVLMGKLPPNTVVLVDSGYRDFPLEIYGGLNVKPEALAVALKWKPADAMTVSRTCEPPSIVYSIQEPFPFEIHQTPELIVFKYEYFDMVRLIFMDGRPHPPESAPHSKTGHSVGRWEGDELVVDTTHLSPATITNNGLDHSERIHVVERYKLGTDGKTLFATQWFEDPKVLNSNGARYVQWLARPGEYVLPYDCDPSLGLEYQQAKQAESRARSGE